MFDQNNRIISILNKSADLVIVSILWCVLSLPLLTMGASSAALYHCVVKSVREDRAYAASAFWLSFKSNLRQTLPFTFFSLLAGAAFSLTIYYFSLHPAGIFSQVYSIFSLFCLFLLLLIQIHAYSLIGRLDLNRRQFFSVLIRLTGRGVFRNLMLLCILVFAAEAALYYPPLLFIIPGACAWLISTLEEPALRKYINYE